MHTPTQADVDRLTEVCRANQSTVDIYKAERDALVARVAELEEALRDVLAHINKNQREGVTQFAKGSPVDAAIKKARAALAKARQ